MKRHFSIDKSQVACGKNNHSLTSTEEKDRVNCIACRSSRIFNHALNKEGDIKTPEITTGLLPIELWTKYISGLPGCNRFPRGYK